MLLDLSQPLCCVLALSSFFLSQNKAAGSFSHTFNTQKTPQTFVKYQHTSAWVNWNGSDGVWWCQTCLQPTDWTRVGNHHISAQHIDLSFFSPYIAVSFCTWLAWLYGSVLLVSTGLSSGLHCDSSLPFHHQYWRETGSNIQTCKRAQ